MKCLILIFVLINDDVEIKSTDILDRLSTKTSTAGWVNSQLHYDWIGNKRGALAES